MEPAEIKERGAFHAGLGLGPQAWQEIVSKAGGIFAVHTLVRVTETVQIVRSDPIFSQRPVGRLGFFDFLTMKLSSPFVYLELVFLLLVCFVAHKAQGLAKTAVALLGLPLAINWELVMRFISNPGETLRFFEGFSITGFLSFYGKEVLIGYLIFFALSWIYQRPDKKEVLKK